MNNNGKVDQTVPFGSGFTTMDVHYTNVNLHYKHKNLVNVVHICKKVVYNSRIFLLTCLLLEGKKIYVFIKQKIDKKLTFFFKRKNQSIISSQSTEKHKRVR